MPRWATVAAVAVLYALSGHAALLLAAPPGHAAPVWAPSGIALVAALFFLPEAVIGAAIGSFLVNAYTTFLGAADFGLAELGLSLSIGVGAAAQTWVAARLVRAGGGWPTALHAPRKLVAALLLGGPVACLINATWRPLSLWAAGEVSGSGIGQVALTWWLGDTFGVVALLPIGLALSITSDRAAWRRSRGLLVSMALTSALVTGGFLLSRSLEQVRLATVFRQEAVTFSTRMENEVHQAALVIEAIAHYNETQYPPSEAGFRHFARSWFKDRELALSALSWVPRISHDDRPAYEQALRKRLGPTAKIRVRSDTSGFVEAPQRISYAPVTFIEPVQGNEAAQGFDLSSESIRAETLARAASGHGTAISGPINLVQGKRSVLLVAAVRVDGRVAGYVSGVLSTGTMARAGLDGLADPDVAVAVQDITTGTPSGSPVFATTNLPRPNEAAPANRFQWPWIERQTINVGGRTWLVDVRLGRAGVAARASMLPWATLAAGTLLGACLNLVILLLMGQNVRVEREVTIRTRELDDTTKALARSNADLTQLAYVASHDLQEPLRAVSTFAALLTERLASHCGPEETRWVGHVTNGAERMRDMIQGLLEFAAVDDGPLNGTNVDMNACLRDVVHDLGARIAERSAQVTVGPLPSTRGDRVQLTRLFQNLTSNAIKFCPEGRTPKIDVSGTVTAEGCRFWVRDNGIGIPAEQRERAFEPFQRLNPGSEFPGTGIGLAQVRRIAERHGGRVWVEAGVPEGLLCCVLLPHECDEATGTCPPPSFGDGPSNGERANRR